MTNQSKLCTKRLRRVRTSGEGWTAHCHEFDALLPLDRPLPRKTTFGFELRGLGAADARPQWHL